MRWFLLDQDDPQMNARFLIAFGLLVGCGETDEALVQGPFGMSVVEFLPGPNAGFGADRLPDIVLGPPQGGGLSRGGLDVLSLGVGGSIVIDLGLEVADGPGIDLIVFENPFFAGGNPDEPFEEFGEVSVSSDREVWHTFSCAPETSKLGCAGWNPVLPFEHVPGERLDLERTGGDGFDLAELGVQAMRYVRIVDLAATGEGVTGGFDLDAVGWVESADSD